VPFRCERGEVSPEDADLKQVQDSATRQSGSQHGMGLGKTPAAHSNAAEAWARQNVFIDN